MADVATNLIAFTATPGAAVAYGGSIVEVIVVASSGAAALVIYDNPSAASGTVLAVIPASAAVGTYQIGTTAKKGVYVSSSSGWSGSIGLSS